MASKKKTKTTAKKAAPQAKPSARARSPESRTAKKPGSTAKAAGKKATAKGKAAPAKGSASAATKRVASKPSSVKKKAGKTKPAAPPKAASAKRSTAKRPVVGSAKKAIPQTKATSKKKTSKKLPTKKPTSKLSAAQVAKQRAQEKAHLAKEKALALKEKARASKEREKEKARLAKLQADEKAKIAKEKLRLQKEKEREKAQELREKAAEKARFAKEKAAEKTHAIKEKAAEKARLAKAKAAEKAQVVGEKDRAKREKAQEKAKILADKQRERDEKNAEKERIRLEKEAEKERIRKEKELEAYKKARATERERVRAEKESARRALEGRVAQQQRRAARIAGTGRGTSSRVYRPDAVPSQDGTRREGMGVPRPVAVIQQRSIVRPPSNQPPPRQSPAMALDERWTVIQQRLARMPERFQRDYAESFDMSWIHHDSALEGVVFTYQELKTAVDPNIVIVPDSSLQPVCIEIRRHKAAIEWARELGKEDTPLSAEVMKRLLLLLHPEEGDLKSVKYRKEIPQHRLYFHDYAPPDKIAVRIRQAFEWLHGTEPPKLKDPVRVAARLHYDLLRTFPFPQDSGKVARLLMNILLLRANLPPVIVHSTERQRYYDALRGSLPTIVQMVNDSMRNAMASIEKVLDEEEANEFG